MSSHMFTIVSDIPETCTMYPAIISYVGAFSDFMQLVWIKYIINKWKVNKTFILTVLLGAAEQIINKSRKTCTWVFVIYYAYIMVYGKYVLFRNVNTDSKQLSK